MSTECAVSPYRRPAWRSCVAFLLAAAAIATGGPQAIAAGPATPAQHGVDAAVASRWRVVYRADRGIVNLVSLTAPSPDDAWAVGTLRFSPNGRQSLFVVHWNGLRWHQVAVPYPSGFLPGTVAASSPGNVWIFGYQPATGNAVDLWLNGSTWRTTYPNDTLAGSDLFPGSLSDPTSPLVLSGPEVWATGPWSVTYPAYPSGANFLWNFRNGQWTTSRIAAAVDPCGAWAGSGSRVWLLAAPNAAAASCMTKPFRPILFSRTGSSWRRTSLPEKLIRSRSWIAAAPGGGLWLLARPTRSGGSWHLDFLRNRRWTRRALPASWSNTILVMSQLLTDGHGGVWLGQCAHWTGRRLVLILQPAQCINLSAMAVIPRSSSAWSLGSRGNHPNTNEILVYGTLP